MFHCFSGPMSECCDVRTCTVHGNVESSNDLSGACAVQGSDHREGLETKPGVESKNRGVESTECCRQRCNGGIASLDMKHLHKPLYVPVYVPLHLIGCNFTPVAGGMGSVDPTLVRHLLAQLLTEFSQISYIVHPQSCPSQGVNFARIVAGFSNLHGPALASQLCLPLPLGTLRLFLRSGQGAVAFP